MNRLKLDTLCPTCDGEGKTYVVGYGLTCRRCGGKGFVTVSVPLKKAVAAIIRADKETRNETK